MSGGTVQVCRPMARRRFDRALRTLTRAAEGLGRRRRRPGSRDRSPAQADPCKHRGHAAGCPDLVQLRRCDNAKGGAAHRAMRETMRRRRPPAAEGESATPWRSGQSWPHPRRLAVKVALGNCKRRSRRLWRRRNRRRVKTHREIERTRHTRRQSRRPARGSIVRHMGHRVKLDNFTHSAPSRGRQTACSTRPSGPMRVAVCRAPPRVEHPHDRSSELRLQRLGLWTTNVGELGG